MHEQAPSPDPSTTVVLFNLKAQLVRTLKAVTEEQFLGTSRGLINKLQPWKTRQASVCNQKLRS